MRKLAGFAVLLFAGLAVPAAADTAEDLRSCDGGNQAREERIAACTRLIDAGDRAPTELVWIHDRRGDLYYGAGEYEAAVADYTVVIEIDPTNWEPYYARSGALIQLRRDEEALADLDRAIELNPRNARSYYSRGLAHRLLDQDDLALADYNQAIQLDPNYSLALLGRGDLHREAGRLDQARADFTVALELAPFDARTYAGRGRINDQEGIVAEAIRDYRVAQLLNPNLRVPEARLPDLVPEQAAPDLGPLVFSPPADGLTIAYVQVVNEIAPEIEEMEAAINDLIFWFVGEPDRPLPVSRDVILRRIGPTINDATEVTVTQLFTGSAIEQTIAYAFALLPLNAPAEEGPDIAFTYDGAAALWQLAPGDSTSGTGTMLIACPSEPDPMAAMLGCQPGVAAIPIGTLEWTATFEGWEYVLVPAGYRVAARISYDEVAETQLFGQSVSRAATTNFWFDPEINWWIKRERTEGEHVQTIEAWTIELP